MTRPLVSIVNRGSKGWHPRTDAGEESRREELLIQRFLGLPKASDRRLVTHDERIAHVGSVLLTSQLVLAQAFSGEICCSPVQRILLFVYLREARGRDTSIRSLCNFPILGPGTVALRWAAKLISDGILELTDAAEASDRLIRLTPDGVTGLERWLRCIDSGLVSDKHAGFSV